jgi:pantetheine-phosphate adenylyltransferase
MIEPNVARYPHVTVTDFQRPVGRVLPRSAGRRNHPWLRALSDFEFEFNMALMNRHLDTADRNAVRDAERANSATRARTLVKQVATFGGDVSNFVPPNVGAALQRAYGRG